MKLVPAQPRNRASESLSAQRNLFDSLAVPQRMFRDNTLRNDLVQISTSFLLCGLPYRPTSALKIVRSSKTAQGELRVSFLAVRSHRDGTPIEMARGADRTYLHWCIDKAIKTRSSFVPLARAKDFFDEVGLSAHGKNYRDLRDSHRRISGLAVVVERFFSADGEASQVMPVIGQSRLPSSVDPSSLSIEGPVGIKFGDDFFTEFSQNHVPFPWPLLRVLTRRCQLQDYILFLHYRSGIARSESLIPWPMLRQQLWQSDSNERRIRMVMLEAIEVLKSVWPYLSASADRVGLRIGPPRDGVYLIPFPGRPASKRLS